MFCRNISRKLSKVMKSVTGTILVALLIFSAASICQLQYAYADDAPNISAESAVVMSGSTGEVVYAYHAERRLTFNVSAKLVNAMVVIDNLQDSSGYKDPVRITKNADKYGDLFAEGERLTVDQLLHSMLLENSEEAAVALAMYSAGSSETFLEEMNSKVQQMRLTDTQFTNIRGAYDVSQFTTAEDAAVIMRTALGYGKICSILQEDSYELKETDKSPARTIQNSNPLLTGDKAYDGMFAGMKGSVTRPAAASTYAGAAYRDDMQMIVILLNEKSDDLEKDATALLDYGYDNVTKQVIVKAGKAEGKVKVRHGQKTRVTAYTARKGYVYIPPEGSEELVTTQVNMYSGVKAPLKVGDKVGELDIYVAGERKGSVDLVVKEDVATGWIPSYIYISDNATIAIGVVFAVILLVILRLLAIRRRNRKEREKKRKEKIRAEALRQKAIEEDRKNRNWTYSDYMKK